MQHQIHAQQVAVATMTQYAKAMVQNAMQELQSGTGVQQRSGQNQMRQAQREL